MIFFERLSELFSEKDFESKICDLTIRKGKDEFIFEELGIREFIEKVFSLSGNMHTLNGYEKLVEKIEGDGDLDWTLIDILRQVRNGEILQAASKCKFSIILTFNSPVGCYFFIPVL